MKALLAIAAVAGLVQDCKECGGGMGLDLPGLGVVHECQLASGEQLELCWRNGDSAELAGSLYTNGFDVVGCDVTQRHLGPCRWGNACAGGGGSNAKNGPWCPMEVP